MIQMKPYLYKYLNAAGDEDATVRIATPNTQMRLLIHFLPG